MNIKLKIFMRNIKFCLANYIKRFQMESAKNIFYRHSYPRSPGLPLISLHSADYKYPKLYNFVYICGYFFECEYNFINKLVVCCLKKVGKRK